jgi:hypothetical protein
LEVHPFKLDASCVSDFFFLFIFYFVPRPFCCNVACRLNLLLFSPGHLFVLLPACVLFFFSIILGEKFYRRFRGWQL